MKINKQSPPDKIKKQLSDTLQNEKNEQYAKRLGALGDGEYKRVIIKGLAAAAAVAFVGVAIALFALIGRELWHGDNLVPATPPDFYNHIFYDGYYVGKMKDGEFSNSGLYFNDLLSKEYLYDINGKKIKEIYIKFSTFKTLNIDETVTIASRLEKFASGEYKNYYKFTLPVAMDDEIPMAGQFECAFTKDEIDNGILPEHKYVSAYKQKIKSLNQYTASLTDADCEAIDAITDSSVKKDFPVFEADLDGDGEIEKIATVSRDSTSDDYEFHYVVVVDANSVPKTCGAYILCGDYAAMRSEFVSKHQLVDIIDFDLNGRYEIVVSVTNENRHTYEIYTTKNGIKEWVTTIYTKSEQPGITIREFAARVANMALGMPYDEEFPSDETCEWYYRYIETENISLDTPMNYNQIYFGVEAFAKLYNIELVGWDKETVWEPIANLYDPMSKALREKAEELLQIAESAFEKSKFKINIDKERAASITITDPNAPNNKTITDKDEIEKIVEFLNKTPIKSAKYIPGLPTSGAPSLSVKDNEGNSLFGCMFEADKFYIRGCEYIINDNYFESILDLQ